ncbi:uncharacterized protein LOC119097308 [Pollicipes pollicipes]|uniref:uncharacterized protein LOC119097308 n=1 Tax=Pollicipes pollicipes TaxID=41117 RepID=UPI00188523E7|nr:uncharacterized protein LOC119097308 [Pollicipes pollicipes]
MRAGDEPDRTVHGVTESGVHWGAVRGHSLKLYCNMEYDGGGWTLLVAGVGEGWDAANALWRPAADEPGLDTPYSIYNLSDAIRDERRQTGNALLRDPFEVDVYDRVALSGGSWRVPRTVSLLRSAPGLLRLSALNGRTYGSWSLLSVLPTAPWLAAEATAGDVLITVQPVLRKGGHQSGTVLGSRPHQQVWGGGYNTGNVVLFIRE